MHTRSKLLLAALTSALLLAALVSSASANRLSQSEASFRVTYSPLSFVPSFGSSMRCPVTLEGTYHSRTIAKTAGALIGYVNRVVIGTCESGVMRANTETLPWHVQYSSFTGTLPTITSISQTLIRPSFEMEGRIFGLEVRCRYTTPRQLWINTRETTRGPITEQRPGAESTTSETGGCPSFRLSGTGRVTTPGGAFIVVTLI